MPRNWRLARNGARANDGAARLDKAQALNAGYTRGGGGGIVAESYAGGAHEWSYIKLVNGIAFAWRRANSDTVDIDNSWGSSLKESDSLVYSMPTDLFTRVDFASPVPISLNAGAHVEFIGAATESAFQTLYLTRPNNATSVTVEFCMLVIGRWD